MRPSDAGAVRDCIVRLSFLTKTGMDYLFGLPLDELARIMQSAGRIKTGGG